jgi:hypothetical protein
VWRAVQSPWLIAALTVATFNLYALWWLGRTWWQLKQEDGDKRKHPVWHALTALVPIYNYFRFHAHMRTIVQVGGTRSEALIEPLPMTVAWIVINLLAGAVGTIPESPGWPSIVLASVCAGRCSDAPARPERTAWRDLPGGGVRARVHAAHVLLQPGRAVVPGDARVGRRDARRGGSTRAMSGR